MNFFSRTKLLICVCFLMIAVTSNNLYPQNKGASIELSFGGNYFPRSNYLKDFDVYDNTISSYSHFRNNDYNYLSSISLQIPLTTNFVLNFGMGYYNTDMLINSYHFFWDDGWGMWGDQETELQFIRRYNFTVVPVSYLIEYYFSEIYTGFSPFLGIGLSHIIAQGDSEKFDYQGWKNDVFSFKENILGYNLSIGFKQNISGSFFLKFRTTFISTKKLRSDISPMWFSRSEEYKIMKLNTFDASIGLGWYLGK
ncbi:hypothetical protein ACFL7D_08895 [candidate division KSB1 bacterium]